MRLCFEPERPSIGRTRTGFAMLASALTRRAVDLQLTSRSERPDPNHAGLTYAAEYRDAEIQLQEWVLGGEGNPRDGYAYETILVLSVPRPGGEARIGLRSIGYEPAPILFDVRIEGVQPRELVELRAAARAVFGENAERSAGSGSKRDTVAALVADATKTR